MNRRIIPLAALLALTVGGVAAQASDNQTYRDRKPGMACQKGEHKDHFQRMADRLKLSEAQQTKARALFADSKKRMRHLYEERRELRKSLAELDPAARDYDEQVRTIARKQGELTAKMTEARAETRKQFHMLLTDEQRAQVKEMRKRFKERKGDKRDGWQKHGQPDNRQDRGRMM